VGVCNVPITAKMRILELLERHMGQPIAAERAELQTLGLNHLSWHRGFTVDGEDVWPAVLQGTLAELQAAEHPEWEPELIANLRMLPNYYLGYYYDTAGKLSAQAQWPPSRAETVMAVEAELLTQYADPERSEPPPGLMQRGGAYYSTVATQLLNAHHNELGETHIVNVRHGGAVPGWPADWVLEMPARISRGGAKPIPAEPLPSVCYGLLAHVKAYELLVVEAAVHGDRQAAYQALLAHPLGPAAHQVREVLEDMLQINRPYLPQFSRV
jgi:6-phospho-beta-glucosidase